MAPRISDELQEAADAQVDRHVVVEHECTQKVYYLYTGELHLRATRAMQAEDDNQANAEGLRELESGQGRPLHEVDADMRKEFGLPPGR